MEVEPPNCMKKTKNHAIWMLYFQYTNYIPQRITMLFERELSNELTNMAKSYPIITITGPRQSGKTTLSRNSFPEKPYVNLESPDIRSYAEKDPRGFLGQYQNGAILDEIQKVPDLLSYIQVITDEKQQKGMFILTGSENLLLSNKISQSLAGRTAILNLWPLSMGEVKDKIINTSIDELLLTSKTIA